MQEFRSAVRPKVRGSFSPILQSRECSPGFQCYHSMSLTTLKDIQPPAVSATPTFDQGSSPPDVRSLVDENRRLRRAVEELSALNDLARTLSAALDPQEIMRIIVNRSMRAVHGQQGVITLIDGQGNDSLKTIVRAAVSSAEHEQFHFEQALLGWMLLNKKPLMVNDPRNDERFRGMRWQESIRSLLCAPMMLKGALTGVLTIYNKDEGKAFTEEDQRLLAIIAAQSAQVMENARLNDREKQLLKMQEEVRLAARIQADLLPKASPVVVGYDIAGKSIPAEEMGGDYFDFLPLDEKRLAISLGDVSGKGLSAALLMAHAQATVRGQAMLHPSATDCLRHANPLLHKSTAADKFITLFYGVLDFVSHRLCFCNAGHTPPFLYSGEGVPRRLQTGGLMLGVQATFPYEEESISLEIDDLLVIFSDGITEATNEQGEQFGEDRLASVIRGHRSESASDIVQAIFKAAHSYAGKMQQADDMTLVVLKRL